MESGLINESVADIVKQIQNKGLGYSSMIMLGNAIFCFGDTLKIKEFCSPLGHTIISKIELKKAGTDFKVD